MKKNIGEIHLNTPNIPAQYVGVTKYAGFREIEHSRFFFKAGNALPQSFCPELVDSNTIYLELSNNLGPPALKNTCYTPVVYVIIINKRTRRIYARRGSLLVLVYE